MSASESHTGVRRNPGQQLTNRAATHQAIDYVEIDPAGNKPPRGRIARPLTPSSAALEPNAR